MFISPKTEKATTNGALEPVNIPLFISPKTEKATT